MFPQKGRDHCGSVFDLKVAVRGTSPDERERVRLFVVVLADELVLCLRSIEPETAVTFCPRLAHSSVYSSDVGVNAHEYVEHGWDDSSNPRSCYEEFRECGPWEL